ncbi:MAG: hypothetical protein QM704_22865 [Anaeromyxobacteraceae bacterium]
MPTGFTTSRVHLRLLPARPAARRPGARAWLVLRTLLALLALALATARSWLSLALALLPLAGRRGPQGRRLRPLATRRARVIPFQPPRTAVPR